MYALTSTQMKQLDRYTIETIGIAGPSLMEIAGNAVVMAGREKMVFKGRIAILCGSGNNGGDGFVIARRLVDLGYDVCVFVATDEQRIRGDARVHYDILKRRNIPMTICENELQMKRLLAPINTIIDCLLGTGMNGALRAVYAWLIPLINMCDAFVIAVDIPSGLCADTGEATEAIIADVTFTLAQPKIGFYLHQASRFVGELIVVDISVPAALVETLRLSAPKLIDEATVRNALPKRVTYGHKGTFGHGAVIGGSKQYVGAPLYSANAAFHSGLGLISLVVPETLQQAIMLQAPYALLHAVEASDGYMTLHGLAQQSFTHVRAIAFGPGLGRAPHLSDVAAYLLNVEGPQTLIIDADGLYAFLPHLAEMSRNDKTIIMTPHPGEMAMLCGTTVADIEANRLHYAKQFAQTYGVYLLLKGHRSIISTPDGDVWILPIGDDALGKGGSGDVLTGMILSFVTQGATALEAMQAASYMQAICAMQLAQKNSHYSVTPALVIEALGETIRQFEQRD